jgi:hypothetical protein
MREQDAIGHLVRWVPETPCGQKLPIVSRSQLPVRVEYKVHQRSQGEENEGLEWDVREELVPGFCPKPVATGLSLCQDEPQVERRARGKGPDLDSRRP